MMGFGAWIYLDVVPQDVVDEELEDGSIEPECPQAMTLAS